MKKELLYARVINPNSIYLGKEYIIIDSNTDGMYLLDLRLPGHMWFHKSEILILGEKVTTINLPVLDIDGFATQLRPFNLEEALAEPSRVVTRCGKKVLYIHLIPLDFKQPLYIIKEEDNCGEYYTKEGKYCLDNKETDYDLFLLPKVEVGYVPVRKFEPQKGHHMRSYEDAYNDCVNGDKVVKVTFCDGIPVDVRIVS